MSSKYQLAVGDRLEFPVKFNLQDGAKERKFGMRLSADRHEKDEQQADFEAQISTQDYLAARNVKLESWIGDSPLRERESGQAVSPSPDALAALYTMVPGLENLVMNRYAEANSAKGRSGN